MVVSGMFPAVTASQSPGDFSELVRWGDSSLLTADLMVPYYLCFVLKVGTDKLLEFKGEDKQWPDSAWVAAPVPSGSLVLIHGQVYHKSEQNTSLQPRHAYTFHVIETEGSHYASKNWLQPTKEPLPRLYFSSRNV